MLKHKDATHMKKCIDCDYKSTRNENSTSHVSDLSMVGEMGIITRGEDSDMGTERSKISISLFSPRVIM